MLKKISCLGCILCFLLSYAQLKNLKGSIIANDEVEGIHILNKTAVKYTVTDTDGSFNILAKVNDTLTISSLKYETKIVVVTADIVLKNTIKIYLTEKVNQLNEVVVGKVLSGSLGSDMSNFGEDTEVNFYDLGISGYLGKPKPLSERMLLEATNETGSNNLGALINLISGRTKMLEQRVQFFKNMKCIDFFENSYQEIIIEKEELTELQQKRFFNFIRYNDDLQNICESLNIFEKIDFLKAELKLFKSRQAVNDKKN